MADKMSTKERAVEPPSVPIERDVNSIDLVHLSRTIYRKRRTVVGVALLAGILTGCVSLLMPNLYTAAGSLLPSQSDSVRTSASALAGQLSALGAGSLLGGGAKSPGDLYVGLLSSRSVADELIAHFNLVKIYRVKHQADARKVLANQSLFEVGAKDSLLTISVTNKDPKLAHDLVQSYMEALHDINSRLALRESSQRRLFFEQQLANEKNSLADAEVDLKKVEQRSGIIAPAGQTQEHIQTLAGLRAQAMARHVELASLRESSTEQNPEVVRLNSEIHDLNDQIARLEGGPSSPERSGPTGPLATSKIPDVELEYVRAEREVKYHEALFEILSRQYESARIDEAHDAPLLQVIDPASMPEVKTSPHRLTMVLIGLLAGSILGCILVVCRDKWPGWVIAFRSGE
jgi:tyrosine-protein kinase Etk/Wzc